MAEVKILIAKTPKQAEKLGTTITEEVSISAEDGKAIRDYYRAEGEQVERLFSDFVSAMVAVGTANLSRALAVVSSVAANHFTPSIFKSYYSQVADKFDIIATEHPAKCRMVYQYKRVGSNDGYYWLKDIKVI